MPHCSPASVAARHSWAPNASASDRVELNVQAPSVTEPATVPPAGPALATRYCWRVASHWAPVARPAAVPTRAGRLHAVHDVHAGGQFGTRVRGDGRGKGDGDGDGVAVVESGRRGDTERRRDGGGVTRCGRGFDGLGGLDGLGCRRIGGAGVSATGASAIGRRGIRYLVGEGRGRAEQRQHGEGKGDPGRAEARTRGCGHERSLRE